MGSRDSVGSRFGKMPADGRPLSRKHSFMPGYGGCVQHEYNKIASTFGKAAQASYIEALNLKHSPPQPLKREETFTANDYYVGAPNPRKKTNSKNRSNLNLGDPRAQTFDTINMTAYRQRDLPMTRAPLVDGFAEMEVEERDKIYRRALERCGVDGVRKLEHDIRVKIEQRCIFILNKSKLCSIDRLCASLSLCLAEHQGVHSHCAKLSSILTAMVLVTLTLMNSMLRWTGSGFNSPRMVFWLSLVFMMKIAEVH